MKKSLFTLLVMMLFGTAIAQPTSSYFRTQFDMGVYENSYSLIAVIKIDGVIQNNLNLELGAWDETYNTYCGGQLGAYYNAYEQGTIPCYYMAVFGYLGTETNPATGESLAPLGQSVISYKLYDHSLGQVLDYECSIKVNWTNTLYGMPSTPVELDFYAPKDMVFEGIEDNQWSNANNWTADGEPAGRLPQAFENVTIAANCVAEYGEAASVTINSGYSLTISEDGNGFNTEIPFTVKDGAQFFAPAGSEYKGSVEKEIQGYGNSARGNYYFISVPVTEFDLTTGFEAAGMLNGDYDLYFFTQNADMAGNINYDNEYDDSWWLGEWQNYKWYLDPDSGMEGAGNFTDGQQINNAYLYANKQTTTLSFNGMFNSGEVQYSCQYVAASEWPGYQLVGNPLPCNASITKGSKISGYYMMNEQGRADVIAVEDPIVAPATALLVVATSGNPATQRRVTFVPSTEEATVRSANGLITIEVLSDNGALEDRAYVRNYESEDMTKFSLNNEGTKIFIPQDGKKYAAVYAGETKSMPLCFTSTEGGIHTITVKAENMNCSYLHLIDNVTGADIDLLRTPKYSFDANDSNYATRFKLVFDEQATNEIADNFAFISNGELMINNSGEATLQVMDITGRILSTENIQNCYSKSLNLSAGVYVVRLSNGNDVKAQKIVVE
jgi:hypothetical protein